jgi:hypothetical protein
MLASVAAMQGRTAMWHALGQAVQPIRWDAVAATIFTDPEVATVGLSPEEAAAAGFPVETARLDFRSNPRAKMIHGTDGFVKVHAMVGSGTVVGGVVVSARASDLIQPLAVAVQNRLSVAQLAQTMTVYPSMAGSVAECARMLMVRLDPADPRLRPARRAGVLRAGDRRTAVGRGRGRALRGGRTAGALARVRGAEAFPAGAPGPGHARRAARQG